MSGGQVAAWSVGIVIPARNEEESIVPCIESILHSCRDARLEDFRVAVVADNCTDRTAMRARGALGAAGEVYECALSSAGGARRLGVDAVLRHFAGKAASGIWLANTDADTTVPRDWLAHQLALADTGVAGIAGIVQLREDGIAAAHELYRRTYATFPDGTHSHVHGANLAMRADAYLDAGGWPHLALAEDHCLWQRLKRRGWRVSSLVSSVVTTSARLTGRAPGGFADTLRANLDMAGALA